MPHALPARPADTDPEAEARQIALLRGAGPSRRVGTALALSATVIALARRALGRAMPTASELDVRLRFVELHYGRDLADGVRRTLAGQRR
jgi:hypothetical protein